MKNEVKLVLSEKEIEVINECLVKQHIYTFYSTKFPDGFSIEILCIKTLDGTLQCQAFLLDKEQERVRSSYIFTDYFGRWNLQYNDICYIINIEKEKEKENDTMNTNNSKTCLQLYVLTEVIAREISEPQIFFSYEDAVKELEERMNGTFSHLFDRNLSIYDTEWETESRDDCGCKLYQDGTCVVYGSTQNNEDIDLTITPHRINIKLSLTNF